MPGMEMPKPTDADKERFRALMPDAPGVEVKPMFGNLGGFVNGNMFAGLFGAAIGVKLAEDDMAELRTVEGTTPFGPAERPMGGYLSLPEEWADRPELATPWVERALGHVSTLPPKAKKPAKTGKKSAKG